MKLTSWPIIEEKDLVLLNEVVESGIFVKGPKAEQLAAEFSEFISVKYCQPVSSCTHAIHLALIALGIGPGDEVMVPNLTYVGSVSPIINAGAKPIFVDVNLADYNISLSDAKRKITPLIKAIIPVHLHGYPCDINLIRQEFPELIIIEDACQAHGAQRDGYYTGTMGDVGCFSLNQVKPLSGGQGGLVVTNNSNFWDKIQKLASPGKEDTIGLSYEITEFSAALTLSQLKRFGDIINKSSINYDHFRQKLRSDLQDCIPYKENNVIPIWHKFRFRLKNIDLQNTINIFEKYKIPYETWPYTLVTQRSEFRYKYGSISSTPISEKILKETIIIGNEKYPFHAQDIKTLTEWADVINEYL